MAGIITNQLYFTVPWERWANDSFLAESLHPSSMSDQVGQGGLMSDKTEQRAAILYTLNERVNVMSPELYCR